MGPQGRSENLGLHGFGSPCFSAGEVGRREERREEQVGCCKATSIVSCSFSLFPETQHTEDSFCQLRHGSASLDILLPTAPAGFRVFTQFGAKASWLSSLKDLDLNQMDWLSVLPVIALRARQLIQHMGRRL